MRIWTSVCLKPEKNSFEEFEKVLLGISVNGASVVQIRGGLFFELEDTKVLKVVELDTLKNTIRYRKACH